MVWRVSPFERTRMLLEDRKNVREALMDSKSSPATARWGHLSSSD